MDCWNYANCLTFWRHFLSMNCSAQAQPMDFSKVTQSYQLLVHQGLLDMTYLFRLLSSHNDVWCIDVDIFICTSGGSPCADCFISIINKKVANANINWLKTNNGSSISIANWIHRCKSCKLTNSQLPISPSRRQRVWVSAEVMGCSSSCFSSRFTSKQPDFLPSSSRHASRILPPDGAAWNHVRRSPIFTSVMQCPPNCVRGMIRQSVRLTTSPPPIMRSTSNTDERYNLCDEASKRFT